MYEQQKRVSDLQQEEIELQAQRIHLLQLQIIELQKFIFGGKQEKFKPSANENALQSVLFNNDKIAEVVVTASQKVEGYEKIKTAIRVNHPGRKPLPDHLRREVIVIEPTEDVTGLKPIGEQITEVLEYKQGELFVTKYVRPEYIKPTEDELNAKRVIASLPTMPLDKCIAAASLLAYLIASKFVDHLPIYRILQMFKRLNVTLDDSTVSGWIKAAANLIIPLYEAHLKEVLAAQSLGVDETPLKVIDKSKKGTTHQGYYWVYYNTSNKLVLFDYQKGRDGQSPKKMLSNYQGYLQVDGYTAYTQFENSEGIKVLNCWAHARRKFIDAQKFDNERASEILTLIAQLYGIEKHCRENSFTSDQIKLYRQAHAIPILNTLHEVLKRQLNATVPSSPLGMALQYTLNRWAKLNVYTQEGFLAIDNNLVENSIRPVAIGRKNWLFAGSHEAAQRSAMFYSLFATCKLHNIDPILWLTDVLTKIKDHKINKIQELLPQNYYSKNNS